MTNDEIIATKVMKYEYMSYISIPPIYWYKNGKYQVDVTDYRPRKNLEQAFEALEKYVKDNALTEYTIECNVSENVKSYRCYIKGHYGEACWGGGLNHWEDTIPKAICATLVEVVRIEEG